MGTWLDQVAIKEQSVYTIPPGAYCLSEHLALEDCHVIASQGAVIVPVADLPVAISLGPRSSWGGGSFPCGPFKGILFDITAHEKMSLGKPLSPTLTDVYADSNGAATALALISNGDSSSTLSFSNFSNLRFFRFGVGLSLYCGAAGTGEGWVTGNNFSDIVLHSCGVNLDIFVSDGARWGVHGNNFSNLQIQPGPISRYGIRIHGGNYNQFFGVNLWDPQKYIVNGGISLLASGRGNTFAGMVHKDYADIGSANRII